MISRRQFIQTSSILSAASVLPLGTLANGIFPNRKFTLCLNPGAIGVKANQLETFNMAVKHGYEAITVQAAELSQMSSDEIKALVKDMEYKQVKWGSAGLPVDFRKDQATFNEGLKPLPEYAKAMNRAGATRMNTWVLSFDHQLTYLRNFKQHTERLREVATILNDHGVRLGLEYVGPRTLQAVGKYSFIRTMTEAKELIDAIDRPNVGLVLDSFHWYCAGEGKEDLLTLTNEDIVAVDLNDARSGFPADEQIDGKRELPSATGVIDLHSFLSALVTIGYDGPIRAEPFNQPLREMKADDALSTTFKAMRKSFDLIE
jgi:sugar phosphate isomerase/epimerase